MPRHIAVAAFIGVLAIVVVGLEVSRITYRTENECVDVTKKDPFSVAPVKQQLNCKIGE